MTRRRAMDDVSQAIRLLEYARSRGFRIGPELHVGVVHMQVADLKQAVIGAPTVDESPMDPDDEPIEGTIG